SEGATPPLDTHTSSTVSLPHKSAIIAQTIYPRGLVESSTDREFADRVRSFGVGSRERHSDAPAVSSDILRAEEKTPRTLKRFGEDRCDRCDRGEGGECLGFDCPSRVGTTTGREPCWKVESRWTKSSSPTLPCRWKRPSFGCCATASSMSRRCHSPPT